MGIRFGSSVRAAWSNPSYDDFKGQAAGPHRLGMRKGCHKSPHRHCTRLLGQPLNSHRIGKAYNRPEMTDSAFSCDRRVARRPAPCGAFERNMPRRPRRPASPTPARSREGGRHVAANRPRAAAHWLLEARRRDPLPPSTTFAAPEPSIAPCAKLSRLPVSLTDDAHREGGELGTSRFVRCAMPPGQPRRRGQGRSSVFVAASWKG